MFSYKFCEIFKNTYFEEHLEKIASICFTSKYYNKYWWQVWTKGGLDRVQCYLNATILFNQIQAYNLYVS